MFEKLVQSLKQKRHDYLQNRYTIAFETERLKDRAAIERYLRNKVEGTYTIDDNGYVSVTGDFEIYDSLMQFLPVAFTSVSGNFVLSRCKKLLSLQGCPPEVGGCFSVTDAHALSTLTGGPQKVKDFSLYECNKLKDLHGSPKHVTNVYNCRICAELTSMEGITNRIDGDLYITKTRITSLAHSPTQLGGAFQVYQTGSLLTLEGAPETIHGDFNCRGCDSLVSLKGAPRYVAGNFECFECWKLETLEGAPLQIGGFLDAQRCPVLKNLHTTVCQIGSKLDCSDTVITAIGEFHTTCTEFKANILTTISQQAALHFINNKIHCSTPAIEWLHTYSNTGDYLQMIADFEDYFKVSFPGIIPSAATDVEVPAL